jgi:rhodanese-related sulfurtransferase
MNFLKSVLGGGQNDDSQGNKVSMMTAAEAKAALNGTERPLLIDVRQPEEFQAGHIEGARLIPLSQLGQRMKELPSDKPILCVCQSGSRSGVAAQLLAKAGYHAINLRGGMVAWQMAGFPIAGKK